jgi:phage FluMu gp28-like protein
MILSERCNFLVDNLDLVEASGVEDARWEYFQLAHLSDDSTFRIEDKSRQIAWSFLVAAEAIANAVLYGTSSMFQSMNQDEAKEKIIYANRIYESLRIGGLAKLTRSNQLEIAFDNGARIISSPGTPQRGKAQFWVYLDEWAHQKHDRANYTASLPIISKGGVIRGGSSPLGASGIFWEIFTESLRKYPGYTRKRTPWWEIYAFSTNVREARKKAPAMPTAQRVEVYGNERIQAIFANMPLEDFQQEYECDFVDETTAWITWDEIKDAQDPGLLCRLVESVGTLDPRVAEAIEETRRDVGWGKLEQVFAAGVDIGRTRNTTEIYLIGLSPTNTFPLRLAITLDNMEFDDQLTVMSLLLRVLPIVSMLIDQNGIGRNLAENLVDLFPSKVQPMDFTNATKTLWATDAKMLIQQHKTPLPADRDLAYQIHSIKRIVTASRNLVFDTERNEKHHADKFWAWALGLAGAKDAMQFGQASDILKSIANLN